MRCRYLERGFCSSLGDVCCSVDTGDVTAINATFQIGDLRSRKPAKLTCTNSQRSVPYPSTILLVRLPLSPEMWIASV